MKYRARTDIVAEILTVAQEEIVKTKIMYKVYLSYSQLVEYLNVLLSNELLEETEGGYKTTKKGLSFLSAYKKLGSLTLNQEKATEELVA